MDYKHFLFTLFVLLPLTIIAQKNVVFEGYVYNQKDQPVADANIYTESGLVGTTTDLTGYFEIEIDTEATDSLIISCMGYETRAFTLQSLQNDNIHIVLKQSVATIEQVEIRSLYQKDRSLIKIEKLDFELLPTTSGEVESIIKNMPGVTSRNELSYQYSVRGGNFDENLVYVNGIEIYRPIIVSTGKQEGLSFINSDLVSSINFSAGGFEARFGDKMSSVLDIKYKKPVEFAADMDMSLLGGSFHVQDIALDKKFTYNIGFRYKSTQYLLNTLDVEGEYDPTFIDFQSFLTYDVNKKLELEFLGNYNLSNYHFVPQTRSTSFGTLTDALNLVVYYEGQERDRFENYLGALSANYFPSSDVTLKFIGSSFTTNESETYDILGEYYLNELDRSMSSDTYGDSIMNLGTGGFLEHARNFLHGNVYSLSHKGVWDKGINMLKWGLKYKHEIIRDETDEWKMVDSAGYSIPYSSEQVALYHVLKANNHVRSNRYSAYVQNTYKFPSVKSDWYLNTGIRASYWDFNGTFTVSPRMLLSFEPRWKREMGFHFAAGSYVQPPFYKEMKRPDGTINRDIEPQKSIHYVLGMEYDFLAWERPFKYTAEIYYKQLHNLIPYKIDNVRVQYAGENMAKGYATGFDMKINGEFVQGVESWASLSIMKTREDIIGDSYISRDGELVEPGYYPRPTDQRINFSLFFQDYIPNYPTYKMHISLHYGSRLPFSPPDVERYDQIFKMPAYRRLDLGFSKSIKREDNNSKNTGMFPYVKSMWIGLDVFNVLDINNTISYQWIKTVGNQQGYSGHYAVPNYLTSRRYNLKLILKF